MPQGRQIGDQPLGKGGYDQPVAIHEAHVAQRGGNLPRQLELCRMAQPHAGRTVQQQMDVAVGLAFEQLDAKLIAAGVQYPVDRLKIVAGRIIAMPGHLGSTTGQLLSRRGQQRTAAGPLRPSERSSVRFSSPAEKSGIGSRKEDRKMMAEK